VASANTIKADGIDALATAPTATIVAAILSTAPRLTAFAVKTDARFACTVVGTVGASLNTIAGAVATRFDGRAAAALFDALRDTDAVPPTALAVFATAAVVIHCADALLTRTAATEGSLVCTFFTTGASVAKASDAFANAFAAGTTTPILATQFASTVWLANHASAIFTVALGAFAAAPATAVRATLFSVAIGHTGFTHTVNAEFVVATGGIAFYASEGVFTAGVLAGLFGIAAIPARAIHPATKRARIGAVKAVETLITPNHTTKVVATSSETDIATVSGTRLTFAKTVIRVICECRCRNQQRRHQNCRPNSSHCSPPSYII